MLRSEPDIGVNVTARAARYIMLLALFGPVAVRVEAAVPVVPGVVASVAGGDDAAS